MKNKMKTLLGVLLALTMAVGLLPGMISTARGLVDFPPLPPGPGHTHSWSYLANGATVTATCTGTGDCDYKTNGITLTINAPSNKVCDGSPKAATITGYPNPAPSGLDALPSITYIPGGSTAPTTPGIYSASFSWGGWNAYVSFTLTAPQPEPEPVYVEAAAANVTAVYDGQPHGITVTVTEPAEGYTVRYGTKSGQYSLTESPTLTDVAAKPLTVYYLVTAYDYEIFTGSATVTITKKAATVTADAQEKVYGSDDPELTAAVTGAVDGEEINYTLSRAAGENAGEYAITVTLGSNPNYDVTAEGSTLTIGKKAATVTAEAKEKVYGSADPALTAVVTGTVGEDKIDYALSREAGENAGEYAITVTPGENPNYDVTVTGGKLTIGKKAASVTADAKEKVYGSADPAFTAVVTGTVGEDKIDYALSREAGENVGEHAIIVTPGQNPNYDVTVTGGKLTITKKAATIVAHDKSKTEGEADPALTAGVKGTVGSDQLRYALYRVLGEKAGTYTIYVSVSASDNPNYAITAVDAVFTVNDAAATAEDGVVIVTEEMLSAQEDGSIIVDLSEMETEITEVVIPGALLAKITEALEIKLAKATIRFDAEAVAAVKEQVGEKDLRLKVDNIETEGVRVITGDEEGALVKLDAACENGEIKIGVESLSAFIAAKD